MGCHTWFFNASKLTFEQIKERALQNKYFDIYLSEAKVSTIDELSLTDVIYAADLDIRDDIICEPLDYSFIFRVYDYNAPILTCYEQAEEFLLEQIAQEKKLINVLRRRIRAFGNHLYVAYMKYVKKTGISFTHTHQMWGRITLYENSEYRTLAKLREFYNKYPEGIIYFG